MNSGGETQLERRNSTEIYLTHEPSCWSSAGEAMGPLFQPSRVDQSTNSQQTTYWYVHIVRSTSTSLLLATPLAPTAPAIVLGGAVYTHTLTHPLSLSLSFASDARTHTKSLTTAICSIHVIINCAAPVLYCTVQQLLRVAQNE